MLRNPPDILITTPESLYLMLTSQAREILRRRRDRDRRRDPRRRATKRGAHLALTLERLERRCATDAAALQRIGLSATQRPLEEIARFLGGDAPRAATGHDRRRRRRASRSTSRSTSRSRTWRELGEILPTRATQPRSAPAAGAATARTARSGRRSTRGCSSWSASTRSTIVFVNSRRLRRAAGAARSTSCAGEDGDASERAHHGSLAREERLEIEERLKAGRAALRSSRPRSLELGIDMGAVDLVIQVESPQSVARGLQRIGRAGHQRRRASRKGGIFPKFRGDLLECAVVAQRDARRARSRRRVIPRNPLDVLAQQIVAMAADWTSGRSTTCYALVRRAAPFAELSREQLEGVLDMLAGRYPSDEFAELRPRIVWDRVDGHGPRPQGRARSSRSPTRGTIPDRGLLRRLPAATAARASASSTRRWSSRRAPGETFLLGASTWRIEEITRDRVIVTPAPGEPGQDAVLEGRRRRAGRSSSAGRSARSRASCGRPRRRRPSALAARATTSTSCAADEPARLPARAAARPPASCPTTARSWSSASATRSATGGLCVLSPFGGRVHAAVGAGARGAASRERARARGRGDLVATTASSSACPTPTRPPARRRCCCSTPTRSRTWSSASSAARRCSRARFRENAARALLLPRRRPGQAHAALAAAPSAQPTCSQVAARYGCVPDHARDLPRVPARRVRPAGAARAAARRSRARELRWSTVETPTRVAVRRVAAVRLRRHLHVRGRRAAAERRARRWRSTATCCASCSARRSCASCSTPSALAELELELQRLTERARATTADAAARPAAARSAT